MYILLGDIIAILYSVRPILSTSFTLSLVLDLMDYPNHQPLTTHPRSMQQSDSHMSPLQVHSGTLAYTGEYVLIYRCDALFPGPSEAKQVPLEDVAEEAVTGTSYTCIYMYTAIFYVHVGKCSPLHMCM